jgi:RNA polymerase sigma-70 factor, ECF subfamily
MDEGSRHDWDGIVEQHAGRVFGVAMRILGSVQDAEDVSQDVFTDAFRMRHVERVQNWTGFLVRLATLRSLDRLRRQRPFQEIQEGDSISTYGPADDAAASELASRLRTAVAELPEQQATVFLLCHFEHQSCDEISVSLGISREAVSTALYKARKRLQTRLATLQPGDPR